MVVFRPQGRLRQPYRGRLSLLRGDERGQIVAYEVEYCAEHGMSRVRLREGSGARMNGELGVCGGAKISQSPPP